MKEAKKIMGKNFIGPQELQILKDIFNIDADYFSQDTPEILFSPKTLANIAREYILILGIARHKNLRKFTITSLRELFGLNPQKFEPCFYNQDWYINESFANDNVLQFQWYLIKKSINEESRGKMPEIIKKSLKKHEQLPSVILAAFTFFAYYFITRGEILWEHDFIWCSDKDTNGDQIYVGRYRDLHGTNQNGFNIHRHLTIRPCYGFAPQIV